MIDGLSVNGETNNNKSWAPIAVQHIVTTDMGPYNVVSRVYFLTLCSILNARS